ncbi:hypothetical protein HHI36_019165 [Cryptolaemus montrouzieri]|uniref:Titin-like n=1 Tax=Cryptolaemus montrouzieri TaxID=559131 RepID=A0ABD2P2U1_9CUCU
MDRSERRIGKRQTGKKVPRVPIKTYKWEDVRRSRRRGGYPWTHLYKEAFNEVDPKDFDMEGLRKNKTSTASSASDSLDIKEITEDDVEGLKNIDSSYVVIESPILLGGQIEEASKDQEILIESADSSDNISQYLDKEERGPQQLESTETLTLPTSSTPETEKERTLERAKSEEPKRKRKLSIESNYSRISLSKLGVMKRLREAKEKIKLPKFGGTSKPEKKKEVKTEETKIKEWLPKVSNNENPVYIHIPLKPPKGEKDDFSHLEFEGKKLQESPSLPPPDVQIEVSDDVSEKDEENASMKFELPPSVQPSGNTLGLDVPNDQEDDVSAIIFLEGDEEGDKKGEYDIMVVDIDENSQEMTMSQVTNSEVRKQVLESIKRVESQAELTEGKQSSGNLSRSSSRASKTSRSSLKKRRAKSVEPEKKRKSSIDSSYSRKSLSKLGFLKKLHFPFRKSSSKKSVTETTSTKDPVPVEKPNIQHITTDQKPVYIHIPLKPPPGETDQFSHLEFETAPPSKPNEQHEEEQSPIESPHPSQSPQFIFLTPPSDDEILDKPDIPETPSSETGSLFQFGELKQLARTVVDQVHGTLDAVDEEVEIKDESTKITTEAIVEVPHEEKDITDTEEKMTIDEEDGLKSTQESKPVLKSNLKGEPSPLPKKKVSFKRRKSSQVSKDDGYEEIESPSEVAQASVSSEKSSETTNTSILENTQSMSVDEEKCYLDSEKVIKSTSLEEDYNKWSKMSDHEYEPVNPPPDTRTESIPLKSHVSEVLDPSSTLPHSDDETEFNPSVQQIQEDIENRFFKAPTNLPTSKSAEKGDSSFRKSPSKGSTRSRSKEKEPEKPNKFQVAIKESATKFKTKLQGIKKPNISLPSRPRFQKPNIKKPNITLPKLPDLALPFRRSSKQEEKKDEPKSENSGGQSIFSTYPRLFKKKKRDFDSGSLKGRTESRGREDDVAVTTYRLEDTKSGRTDSIRIPLHSEQSMDEEHEIDPQLENEQEIYKDREERMSPSRYQQDTDADDEDAEQRERQEKHRAALAIVSEPEPSRWDRGNFYETQNGTDDHYDDEQKETLKTYEDNKNQEIITDLDQPEDVQEPHIPDRQRRKLQQNDSIDTSYSRDVGSSVSSLGYHRRGVLEEIDSDQFFLREKGISQDNIDMGRYLSTEIREAFRMPTNALADMRAYNYEEVRASNQSLPETKRKQIKKPKRKKTPHASQERLRYEQESENEDYNFMPPIRPRRRSKRRKRPVQEPEAIPYTETVLVEPNEENDRYEEDAENLSRYYENNVMEGKEQPDIHICQPYKDVLHVHDTLHRRASEPVPSAPTRKHKSLKSLNASEHESIFDDYEQDKENNNINGYVNENAFMSSQIENPTAFPKHFETSQEIPRPPKRRSRSKTRSMSRTTSHTEAGSILDRTDSIMFDEDHREPIVEEPCIKDLRDAMGYAIVDKNQNKNWEHKFCTVPRSHEKESSKPERPLRNYSTLGPSRPPRKLSRNMTDEEKENIDITQYIEIEDERDLQSGEIIQKMQNRPLPAPPRPPRARSKPLNDITTETLSSSNIVSRENLATENTETCHDIEETEVSTQTEPLPADFVCEEVPQEETDKIMTPSMMRKQASSDETEKGPQSEIIEKDVTNQSADEGVSNQVTIERVFITPTQYSYQEETVTHGQLLVEPLNGAKILPDSELSRERIIPVTVDEDDTSEIPESFKQLSDPKPSAESETEPQKPPRTQTPRMSGTGDTLKLQKLQVSDIDVDRLTVNELVANKIIVSEIDSGSINTYDVNSKSGTLKLSDIELEPSVIERLLEKLKESSALQQSILEDSSRVGNPEEETGQKKTPMNFHNLEPSTSLDCTKIVSMDDKDSCDALNEPELFQHSIDDSESPKDIDSVNEKNTPEVFQQSIEYSKSAKDIDTANENTEPEVSQQSLKDSETPKDIDAVSEKNTPKIFQQSIENSKNSQDVEVTQQMPAICAEDSAHSVKSTELEENSGEIALINSEDEINLEAPIRPPRNIEKKFSDCGKQLSNDALTELVKTEQIESDFEASIAGINQCTEILEPEVDDEPPPRPPQPQVPYVPSQPPASFYALRAQQYVEGITDDIPLVPRRKRHHRPPTVSRSTSSESSDVPVPRRRVRSPEPSIPQLSGQLLSACSIVTRNRIKRLIEQVNSNISNIANANPESNRQDVQVIIVILLVLIAGLLLLGYGDGRTVHLHHWEYFNPPKDI